MSLSIGIIGLPNVGKSTLFKALTKKQVNISAYPFCTINPNIGVIEVPDERLDKLAEVLKPKEIIPATIKFIDIAGLVKNAHQGEGLGNQFLSHIREVAAICHLVRIFQDEKVSHLTEKIGPKEDVEIVNLELIFADLDTTEKKLETLKKKVKTDQSKTILQNIAVLEKIKTGLEKGKMVYELGLTEEEKELIKELNLLTLKPVLYVLNIDELQIGKEIKYQLPFINYLPICAKLESELADLPALEAQEYIKELNLKTSGLDQFIKDCYGLLDLITFFTCQNDILQAWTLPEGNVIIKAAAKIHTDFAQGFIKADVINWQKFVEAGSEHKAYAKGWIRTEGKDYLVKDGDVIRFKFKAS